ncbi:MAG: SGNH/GDSL hydrolase family protein [Deltaproteobacteria bacterium]|nr:SGNH/GDSL hydrolase family protein [Deltaproteobacteria bacterium]
MRVVCLGASPTFGWGVDEAQTYPAVLERALQKRGLDVQVINAGVPGYTSWQGLRWLKSGGPLEWHPDALTIAYDLNDLDRFRFFGNNGRTDADQPPSSETAAAVQNLLNRSAAYRMFRKSLMGAVGRRGDFEAADMPRRVPVEDYAANLTEISHLARARGLDLVYLKMPFHFPFDRVKVRDPERAAKRRREAGEALARGDRDAARRAFEESLEADPTQGGIYEPYVKLLAEMGEDEAAGRVRWLIPFIYAFSDRADLRYNAAVADVALKTGRPLADVVEAFDRDGRGDGLWNSAEDPFHPNAAGHAIVAEIVADILEPILRKRG